MKNLDEYSTNVLLQEIHRRERLIASGNCDYCGRSQYDSVCKFPERHIRMRLDGDKVIVKHTVTNTYSPEPVAKAGDIAVLCEYDPQRKIYRAFNKRTTRQFEISEYSFDKPDGWLNSITVGERLGEKVVSAIVIIDDEIKVILND